AGGVARSIRLLLTELVLVELPDAARVVEQRARVLTRDLRPPILRLTGVRRSANADVEPPASVERNALVLMGTRDRQVCHDDLGGTRFQRTRRELEAFDRTDRGDVDVAVSKSNAGRALVAKTFGDIELAVAVRVAQSDHTSWMPLASLRGDIQVAVGHRQ